MFDELLDLPGHPLVVHLPIVLIPLLIATSVVYATIVVVRPYVEWAVVGLAVAAPTVTWVARESGYGLKERLAENFGGSVPDELAADIDEHARLSYILIWLVVALAAVMLLFVVETRRESGRLANVLGVVLVVGLSAAVAWYLFKTGDLGARMVWEGQ
jgi:uncharacterized membrane protein